MNDERVGWLCRCRCGSTSSVHPFWVNWHSIRFNTLQVVKHPAFEYSILILIFGSSITLCFEDIYLEENEELQAILRWTNVVFAILFAVEMLFKWIALGLRYYFSSVWTALDFVIVMVSLISVGFDDSANLSALRSLRTLRALRPLRAISRWQGMKVILYVPEFILGLFIILISTANKNETQQKRKTNKNNSKSKTTKQTHTPPPPSHFLSFLFVSSCLLLKKEQTSWFYLSLIE